VPYKQIVIAAGDGAKAALSAFDHLIRLPAAATGAPRYTDAQSLPIES
jgi:alkyl hydroperoxide reductase subunit F